MAPSRPPSTVPDGLWKRPDMVQALAGRDMGTSLKIFRKYTGTSQSQIATMTAIPQSAISDILNGKRQVTALDMFERLADGLGIPRRLLGLAEARSVERAAKDADGNGRSTPAFVEAAAASPAAATLEPSCQTPDSSEDMVVVPCRARDGRTIFVSMPRRTFLLVGVAAATSPLLLLSGARDSYDR